MIYAEYIYGDTDSVFFTFNLKDLAGIMIKGKKALEITIELAIQAGKLVSKFLKWPHDLEYEKTFLPFLLLLFAFGIGKAALMPIHWWLPAAMVAPTPVSALLHAVAVVKAGVFSILMVICYTFGIDLINSNNSATILIWIATITLFLSSIIAIKQNV